MTNFFEEEKYQSLEDFVDQDLKKEMTDLFKRFDDSFTVLQEGDLIEGEILEKTKNMLWLVLNNHFMGLIPPREVRETSDIVSKLQVGDRIKCFIIEPENEDGYAICSLRKAGREEAWKELKELYNKRTVLNTKPVAANKGGLMVEIRGIKGFLPVSQLSREHYPRVKDGNEQEILSRLLKLVGKPLKIRIISAEPEENKLIVSEKEAYAEEIEGKIAQYKEGQIVEGKIIGLADFGAFVDLGDVEGLVHISEITWEKVDKIENYVSEGEKLKLMVIGTDQGKVSLSLKRLKKDPWMDLLSGIKVGDKVKGEVIRIIPFGVFVKLKNGLEGLVHISELSFDHISNPQDVLKVGDKVDLKVIKIDPLKHKIELSYKQLHKKVRKESEPVIKLDKEESIDSLRELLSKSIVDKLKKAGYKKIGEVMSLKLEDLAEIPGIGSKTAQRIFKSLR